MTSAERSALRQGLAVLATALLVGSFHIIQPFLAILAAQLVGGLSATGARGLFHRLGAAWTGTLTGLLLLVGAPDQQWVSLPLFCLASGFGTVLAFRHFGAACGILFAMGLGGMFSAGIVYPVSGLLLGLNHIASLSIAVLCTSAAARLCEPGRTTPPDDEALPPPRALITGLAGVVSLILVCTWNSTEAVITTIAAITTSLAFETSTPVGQRAARILGAILGIFVSIAFIIVISGAGNDFAVFLLGLAGVLAAFEWLASRRPEHAILFRQAAALFAVAATILPSPSVLLTASGDRILAVCLGVAVAIAFSLIPRSPAINATPHALKTER